MDALNVLAAHKKDGAPISPVKTNRGLDLEQLSELVQMHLAGLAPLF